MTDVERRAFKALAGFEWGTMPMLGEPTVTAKYAVGTLFATGFLVTPLHERALEACKEMAREFPLRTIYDCHTHDRCATVGREALAAEKPKGRWTVTTDDRMVKFFVLFDGKYRGCFYDEADAYNYVRQQNREEAGK